jgi:hypothetical protein
MFAQPVGHVGTLLDKPEIFHIRTAVILRAGGLLHLAQLFAPARQILGIEESCAE